MKTILVITGLLMTGASVYGVIDYTKKADSNEFKQLYKEVPNEKTVVDEKPAALSAGKKNVTKTDAIVKTKEAPEKKAVKKKNPRKLQMKKFSREALD